MIYMTRGVPPLCQNGGECARIIRDGENGMLAATPEEWAEKLDLLIQSPARRREMGQRALDSVRSEHSLAAVFRQLDESLLTVMASPVGLRRRLRRLVGYWR
jgi:glycosyltransferase involved in cell wall biosynthesis